LGELPSGTVTFLFTDVEGSTRLWEEHPDEMHTALARHDEILRGAVEANGGYVVKMTGDGVHGAFATAHAAVSAAVHAQLTLGGERWSTTSPLRVRMGVHTGHAEQRAGDYFGPALNRAARLMSVAHGGQIVVSGAAEELSRDALPESVVLADLGFHRLRDLGHPEHVFQVIHPDLDREFLPLASVESYPTNLPQQLTTFVGREEELAEVVRALDEVRVVTLTGVGGVGKTRLALQTAAEVLPRLAAGAWLCELGPLSEAAGVPELVATTLSIQPRPGESITESVVGALRDREILLVVDNCEHLIVPAARLVDAVVRACPSVRVLATSREGLGVSGERLIMVRSLGVADEDASPDVLITSDAVQLFVDRAKDARSGFAATPENASDIGRVCRRLDGIPLAIELAAARTRMMSPGEIARRLDERFRLLTGGSRTAVERHQTLRAAVDWSYALLDPHEQAFLDRLGVFAGGFTLEAADAVAGDGVSNLDVLDRLGQLVDKSLVVPEDVDGDTRYRLLETIRQYALEHLDTAGATDDVRGRHAEYYRQLVEGARAAFSQFDVDEIQWYRIVERELANCRAALEWAIGIGDADAALRLAVPLGEFGAPRPRYTIARWLVNVVDMPAARDHPLRPYAAAWAAQGEASLGTRAALAARVREMDVAFEEAGLELSSVAYAAHASLSVLSGEEDDAIKYSTAAADLALTAGDRRWAAVCLGLLAVTLAFVGRTDEAIQRADDALALAAEIGTKAVPAETALGVALSQVDLERAIPQLQSALALSRQHGNESMEFSSGSVLAHVFISQGELITALELYDALIDRAMDTRNPSSAYLICESLGTSLAAGDQREASTVILGATTGFDRAVVGFRRQQRLDAIERLQAVMEPETFDQCFARGKAMTTEELLTLSHDEVGRLLAEYTA
jgi:predicted ATPase/class 3 adenylate cyclase/tetratricopeptide (TPR) repeat protein